MTKRIASVPNRGLKEWVLQRVTAVYLLLYFFILIGLFIQHPPKNYTIWLSIFEPNGFKILSILAFVSVLAHTWVGIWTIFTDYIHPWKLRFVLMIMVAFLLFFYFVWFIQILWGI